MANKSLKNIIKMLMQHFILPVAYDLNRFKPVNEKQIIMADMHHITCPYHMRYLRSCLKAAGFEVVDYYYDVNKLSTAKAFMKMLEFMRLYATSGAVVICDNYLPVAACRKRKATKVIQLWHGSGAFKKFGFDVIDDIPEEYIGNVYKNYDFVAVSSSACVPYFAQAMKKEYDEINPIGAVWTDQLYDDGYIERIRNRFFRNNPEAIGKKIVLWAPTFRGNAGSARVCGTRYIERLKNDPAVSEKCYIIDSVHPHIKQNSMTAQQLMLVADVLVTDYSSVFFDYLILDRPIIFFAPDYKSYATKRGFYLDYKTLPGPIIANEKDRDDYYIKLKRALVKSVVLSGDKDTEDMYQKERIWFKNKYMNSCDGKTAERIIEYLNE